MAVCYGSWMQAQQERANDEGAARADLGAWLAEQLMAGAIKALENGDLTAQVWTPGFAPMRHQAPVGEVLAEAIHGEEVLPLLGALLAAASKSTDVAPRLAAQCLIARIARDHADYHSSDALEQELARLANEAAELRASDEAESSATSCAIQVAS